DGSHDGISPGKQIIQRDHANSRPDSTEEIKMQEFSRSPSLFKICSEHPERQHVPDDVPESGMQEHVGGKLPHEKVFYDELRRQRQELQRPVQLQELKEKSGQKNSDVADQQPLHTFGKTRHVESADRSRSTAERHGETSRLDPEYHCEDKPP